MVSRCSRELFNIHRPGGYTQEVADRFGCSLFQAALLEMRGVTLNTFRSVVDMWLKPDMEYLLGEMQLGATNGVAADIFRNLNENSNVIVYGDYDVDGIAATTIAMSMVLSKRARVRYFIPHRFKQGYGLHMSIAKTIAERKCDLLIIVDCGTQNIEEINLIRSAGIPVVVLDHHLAENGIARCETMVNPHLLGDATARKLCAAGVIWCWAWQNELIPKDKLYAMLDLVALATVADCVSLASPLNRILVRKGLEQMRTAPRQGLAMLMEKLMVSPDTVSTEDLSMKIIPCLNAAGRLELADTAVDIFFPTKELAQKVDKIITLNRQRRELSMGVLEQISLNEDNGYNYVLSDNTWSAGVLSSVASRVCSEKNKPIALVAGVGGVMRGTLRMPAGGDAVAVLAKLSDKLNTWGGHRLAAGFSVLQEQWQEVRDELEEMLSNVTVVEEKEDILYWKPELLNREVWNDALALGPFGMDNPAPLLYAPYDGYMVLQPLGRNGRHLKIELNGATMLAFNAVTSLMNNRKPFEGWIYKPRLDTWRNVTSLQLILEKIVDS